MILASQEQLSLIIIAWLMHMPHDRQRSVRQQAAGDAIQEQHVLDMSYITIRIETALGFSTLYFDINTTACCCMQHMLQYKPSETELKGLATFP